MKILADESVDYGIILKLRQDGFEVISILEDYPGISDIKVLDAAVNNNCLLITEDKDFGELTYRLKLHHAGILLIRLSDIPRKERMEMVPDMVQKHFEKLINSFSVLTSRNLRIKAIQSK